MLQRKIPKGNWWIIPTSLLFCIALLFTFTELPQLLDEVIQEQMGFPSFDQGAGNASNIKSGLFISNYRLRMIGYGSLLIIAVLIVIGYTSRRTGLASFGAFAIFLPVFGQFALSMFFLAGLGLLRIIWFPFMDISTSMLSWGHIAYFPYDLLVRLLGDNSSTYLPWIFMSLGSFLFCWGVVVWIQTRYQQRKVAAHMIYKISRHPQYLGWIIWSYGYMLYSVPINDMKKSWGFDASFPWLLSTMIIIGVCLLEEQKMSRQHAASYTSYQAQTPFLFPLPKWIKTIVRFPVQPFLRNGYPSNTLQTIGVIGIYTALVISLSILTGTNDRSELQKAPMATSQQLDSLLVHIEQSADNRRTTSHYMTQLYLEKNSATPYLLKLLQSENAYAREMAAAYLGDLKAEQAITPLIDLLNDETPRVRNNAARALGAIGDTSATRPLFKHLDSLHDIGFRNNLLLALSHLKAKETIPYLIPILTDSLWYSRTMALIAITEIDSLQARPFVYQALHDPHPRVRRQAVDILLFAPHPEALPYLETIANDPDFETRFYARQAIRLIQKE